MIQYATGTALQRQLKQKFLCGCLPGMNTHKQKETKPANNDPVKEAIGHPSGPDLEEMLGGQENKKLNTKKNARKAPEDPDIPVI